MVVEVAIRDSKQCHSQASSPVRTTVEVAPNEEVRTTVEVAPNGTAAQRAAQPTMTQIILTPLTGAPLRQFEGNLIQSTRLPMTKYGKDAC